jgi:hypothetical protein
MQKVMVFAAFIIGLLTLVPEHRSVEAQGGLIVVTGNADITGTAAAVQASSSGTARWVQVIALTGNSAVIRCGGSTVSATVGTPVAAGGGLFYPVMAVDSRQAVNQHYYNLAGIYCYVGSGDKVNFSWGN